MAHSLRYAQDIDISSNGDRVLLSRTTYEGGSQITSSAIVVLDVAKGITTLIAEAPRDEVTGKIPPLDHAHFSPFDSNWICFCDGSPRTLRRTWVWHPTMANPAKPLADQSKAARPFMFTHERALFDRPSLLTVAPSASTGVPRGLYEIPLSGGPPRLVSESQ